MDSTEPSESAAIAAAMQRFPSAVPGEYTAAERTKYLLQFAQLVESRVQFESGWIGHRVSWLVTSQAFLFGAFALAAGHQDNTLLNYLQFLLPVVAIVQASLIHGSIRAAKQVNKETTILRGWLDAAIATTPLHLPWPILGVERFGPIKGTFQRGGVASAVLPVSLIVTWSLTLLVRVGMEVLVWVAR